MRGNRLGWQVELASAEKLPVFHQIVGVFGAIGVGLNKLLGLTVVLLIPDIILFEVGIIAVGHIIIPLHLGNSKDYKNSYLFL